MSNETIFREVDEELRGDRMRRIWKRIGPYVIGAAVAVVLVVAANEGWSWWQGSNAARSSDQFYAALELAEAGDVASAQTALNDVVTEGSGGYPTLARFRQAALLAAEGKRAEAIAAYDALATSETNPRLRELALVLAAYLVVDDKDVAAVLQRVGGLVQPGAPLRNAARETIGLAQYASGDLDAAYATFAEILADPLVGQEMRGRVQVYAAQLVALGAEGADDEVVEAAPAAGASPGDGAGAPAEGAEPVAEVPTGEADAAVPATEEPATPSVAY